MRERLPSQKLGMAYAKRRRCIDLWMEQRTGKTGVAAEWASSRHGANHILVVTPKATIPNWCYELMTYYNQTDIHVPRKGDDVKENKWHITNPEKLYQSGTKRVKPTLLATSQWDCVLIDESVKIKNPKTKITKIALKYLSKAKYKATLSGLPNPEGIEDLVCQCLFTRDTFMGCDNYWQWDYRYCGPHPSGYGRTVRHKYRDKVLAAAYKEAFVLRARDVGLDTDIEYSTIHVELPKKVMNAMKAIKEDRFLDGRIFKHRVAVETAMQQLAGGVYPDYEHNTKAEVAAQMVEGIDKGVVWFRYNSEIERVATLLPAKAYYVLTGNQTPQERHEIIDRWDRPVLLYQIAAATYGINLSACDQFIYYSNYWDLDTRRQNEARGKHALKQHGISITDIVGIGTPDQRIVNAFHVKEMTADRLHSLTVKELARG